MKKFDINENSIDLWVSTNEVKSQSFRQMQVFKPELTVNDQQIEQQQILNHQPLIYKAQCSQRDTIDLLVDLKCNEVGALSTNADIRSIPYRQIAESMYSELFIGNLNNTQAEGEQLRLVIMQRMMDVLSINQDRRAYVAMQILGFIPKAFTAIEMRQLLKMQLDNVTITSAIQI